MPAPMDTVDKGRLRLGGAQLLATIVAPTPPPAAPRLPDLPRLVPLSSAQRTFGPSRATFYRAAAARQVRMVKVGRGSFLETESVLAWMAGLPAITPKIAA